MDLQEKDSLQIKIDEAKENLSEETLTAINAVNWRAVVLSMRERRGYSFSQLEDLELETELLIYGLISPEEFQKKTQDEMQITKEESAELINQLNTLVFQKIREELIKITESKKSAEKKLTETEELKIEQKEIEESKKQEEVLAKSGINITLEQKNKEEKPLDFSEKREEMLKGVENPESIVPQKTQEQNPVQSPKSSLFAQKLSGSFQMPKTETKHEETIGKNGQISKPVSQTKSSIGSGPSKIDPYREAVE
jgi:hypothetical protein